MADLTYTVDISTKKALSGLKKLQKEIKKTDSTFGKLGKSLAKGSFKIASGGLKSLAATATVASAAFVAFGVKAINVLDDIEKASSKLGVSSRFLTSWQKVARQAGLTTENFTIGLQRFLRRIGEAQIGTGTLVKPLEEMGISLRDANGNLKDGTVVFEEYIKVLSNTESSTKKLRLAFAAFDTEGVAMVNIAKMSSEEIDKIRQRAEEAGIVIDTKLVVAAAKAKDAFADLVDVGKGFGLQFFGSLAPALETFTQDLRKKILEAVEGAGGMEVFSRKVAAGFLEGMASFVDAMAGVVDAIVNAFRQGSNILADVIVAISKIPGVGFDAVIGDAEDKTGAISALKKEIQDLDKSYEEMAKASLDVNGNIDQGMASAMDGILLSKKALQEQIKDLENDTTLYLSKFEGGSSAASDAVAGVTDKLREQAGVLQESAEQQKIFQEALKNAPKGLAPPSVLNPQKDPIVPEDTTNKINLAAESLKQYDDAILRHMRIQEANKEAQAEFVDSFQRLKERLLPLQTAQKQYNKELSIMNKALKEGLITEREHATAVANLKDAYNDFQDSMEPEKAKTWADGWKEAFSEYAESARDSASQAKELFSTATRGMEDAFVEFAKTGKMSFKSLMADLTEQLMRSQIRRLFADILEGGGTMKDLKGVFDQFAGAFAQGGYIPGGKFGLVGERGPELISGPAQVTPLTGGMGNVTYNINAVDTDSFNNLIARDPGFIHGVVMQGSRL
jgi:Ca2+-binding EF-hand superfamily protein